MYRSQKNLNNKKYFVEIVGWAGVLCILAAYGLLSFSVIGSKDVLYIVLNIVGSAGLVFQSFVKKDYEPAALNFIWILFSLFALSRVL